MGILFTRFTNIFAKYAELVSAKIDTLTVGALTLTPPAAGWVLLGSVTYADGDGTAKKLYTIPEGKVLLRTCCVVMTAINGTTPSLLLGTASTADAFMAAGDITEGTPGAYTKAQSTEAGEGGADVYAKLTASGATAGEAQFWAELLTV